MHTDLFDFSWNRSYDLEIINCFAIIHLVHEFMPLGYAACMQEFVDKMYKMA